MFRLIRMLTLVGAVTAVLAGSGPPATAAIVTVGHLAAAAKPPSSDVGTPAPASAGSGHAATSSRPPVKAVCVRPTRPGQMQCLSEIRTNVPAVRGLRPAASPPSGYGPADLASAYKLPADGGAGQTVAIVDAGDDPTAEADLGVYRQQYGLPPCTTANGCFSKVNQQGQQDGYPPEICDPANGCWPVETSLDLQMVSAACPKCKILLVEAKTANISDLGTSVNEAVALGAKFVSNSYGGSDSPSDAQLDTQYYQHPGVAITVSAGDNNYGVSYPAASQYVTSVGGTTLTRDTSTRGWTETVWSHDGFGTGSGCSSFEAKPTFQTDTGCTNRTVADVSAVADPATGLAVYDTSGEGGWLVVGGTSASSPLIAGIYALAGPPGTADYPNSYPYANPAALNDVTSGSNGTCAPAYLCTAGPGYDGPTGLGTPSGVAAFGVPGPHGTVSGVVTDAATHKPIPGATITEGKLTVHADQAGTYQMVVPGGSYSLAVSAYGYVTQTSQVTVTDNQTLTQNFALAATPRTAVTGIITDGSGHGWPLYATITAAGTPQPPVYTDPVTGRYTIELPQGATYTLHVTANTPGYLAADQQLTTNSGAVTQNVVLNADTSACTAPGYSFHYQGLPLQTFDSASAPPGWNVKLNSGTVSWAFDDRYHMANLTGGTGGYVGVSTIAGPVEVSGDTSLITPVANLTSVTAPVISFNTMLYATAHVDLSLNGGSTWSTIWSKADEPLGSAITIPIPQAAGQASVRVRFHFADGRNWQVDNVYVGTRTCTADAGGLMTGRVLDANTGNGVNLADVTSVSTPGDTTVTANPGDPSVGDGFFTLFSHDTGHRSFNVSAEDYQAGTQTADVAANTVTKTDFSLKAGRLSVSSAALTPTAQLGASATTTFTIKNTGTAPATVSASEQRVQMAAPTAALRGGFATGASQAPVGRPSPNGRRAPAEQPRGINGSSWASFTDYPSHIAGNAVVRTPDGKIYSFGGSYSDVMQRVPIEDIPFIPQSYVYDPATGAWTAIAAMPVPVWGAAAGLVNGKIVVAGGYTMTDTTAVVQIYDPATNRWAFGADMPQPRGLAGAAVFNGQLYVVGGRLCTQGSCSVDNSSTVFAYDANADQWTTAADFPVQDYALACGGFNSQDELVCAGGSQVVPSGLPTRGYAYHPESNTWTRIADLPMELWLPAYTVANNELVLSGGWTRVDNAYGAVFVVNGYAYDPAKNAWTSIPSAPFAYADAGMACGLYRIGGINFPFGPYADDISLSGFNQCSPEQVSIPWLSATSKQVTLQPGQSTTITVKTNAASPVITQPGTYRAALSLQTNTPYPAPPVGIRFTVTPPLGWGEVSGTVTGLDCNGIATPLNGATVEVDSAAGDHTLTADASGQYSYWTSISDNPLTVIASNDGYLAQTNRVSVTAGQTATDNFALKPAQGCP